MVDEEHPLLYKPYDHVEFLKYYYTAQGQRDQFSLRTYCGVWALIDMYHKCCVFVCLNVP